MLEAHANSTKVKPLPSPTQHTGSTDLGLEVGVSTTMAWVTQGSDKFTFPMALNIQIISPSFPHSQAHQPTSRQ